MYSGSKSRLSRLKIFLYEDSFYIWWSIDKIFIAQLGKLSHKYAKKVVSNSYASQILMGNPQHLGYCLVKQKISIYGIWVTIWWYLTSHNYGLGWISEKYSPARARTRTHGHGSIRRWQTRESRATSGTTIGTRSAPDWQWPGRRSKR